MFTINSAAKKLGLNPQYIRKMVHNGRIKTSRVQISEKVWRHEITEAELTKFRASVKNRSKRSDGRNKYTAYFTDTEYKQVQRMLKEVGADELAKLMVRTNKKS